MTLKVLNKKEKREIETKLKSQFGIKKIPGLLIKTGKEKLFLFSGNFGNEDIKKFEKQIFIEKIGIYFAKFIPGENVIKLSIEGTQILKSQIKKNILEINEKQAEQWMKGQDLQIQIRKKGFLIIKHGNDFLGCGKVSEKKIGNFIPKSRRLKEKG